MRIAVISDIHSNVQALEAVWNDIQERDALYTVCCGDLVGYGANPNEVIDFIREENILSVQGNYDDAVGNMAFACGCDYSNNEDAKNSGKSLSWSIENTSEDNLRFLRELPTNIELNILGNKIKFVHGSTRKNNEYLFENSDAVKEVIDDFKGDILVCGHTHFPYSKKFGEKSVINAGSVGKPKFGRPNASYVIIDIKENCANVEIIEVQYDYEKAATAVESAGLPKRFAEILRNGK